MSHGWLATRSVTARTTRSWNASNPACASTRSATAGVEAIFATTAALTARWSGRPVVCHGDQSSHG